MLVILIGNQIKKKDSFKLTFILILQPNTKCELGGKTTKNVTPLIHWSYGTTTFG